MALLGYIPSRVRYRRVAYVGDIVKKSRRYCLFCRKVTTWVKKKKLLHSRCSECGGYKSARRRDNNRQGKRGKNENG